MVRALQILCVLGLLLLSVVQGVVAQPVLVPELIEVSGNRSGNYFKSLFEDSRGFAWGGTMVDLIRYDGFSVKHYTYTPKDYKGELIITSITEDADGNIWCSSRGHGLLVLPFTSTGFGSLTEPKIKGNAPKPKKIECDKRGNVWGLTINDDLFFINKTDSTVYTWPTEETGKVTTFSIDNNGGIWYFPAPGGVYYCKNPQPGKKLISEKLFDGTIAGASISDNELFFFEKTTLYKTSLSDGRHLVKKLASLPAGNQDNLNKFEDITADPEADFVLAITINSELLLIDKITGEITQPVLENINPARIDFLNPLIVSTKLIFVGTNKGILRIAVSNSAFTAYTDTANPQFRCVTACGNDTLLLGTTGQGLFMYTKNTGGKWTKNSQTYLYKSTSIGHNIINTFFRDRKNQLWVATNNGLFRQNGKNWELVLPNHNIWGITEDDKGILWLGNYMQGLVSFNPANGEKKTYWQTQKTEENQADKHYKLIWQTKYHKGKIYLGTAAGMLEFDIKKETFNDFYNTELKLVPVWDLYITDSLWLIPTQGKGLWEYRPANNTFRNIGEPTNSFFRMGKDGGDNFWVINDKGVARIKYPDNVEIYKASDGLNTNFFSYTGIARLGENQMVFCGEDGFTIVETNHLKSIPASLKSKNIFISSLKYAGLQVSDYLANSSAVTLDYAKGPLLFEWAKAEGHTQKEILYYKLEGEDENWNTSGYENNTISYTNLSPGTYTFRAFTENASTKNKTEYTLTIIISPPFWLTLWFKLIVGFLLIAAFSYVAYEWATRQKLKHAKLKSEIEALRAQINPHFIFNALNSIQAFIYTENKNDANEYLAKFARLMRLILENSREEIITLQQEKGFLHLYLEMEMLRFKGAVSYTIDVDENCRANIQKIPSMLIQPLIENSLKYALDEAKGSLTLVIKFSMEEDNLVCEITDNGKGFYARESMPAEGEKRSMGIKLVKERLETLSKIYKKEYKIIIRNLQDFMPGTTGAQIKLIIPQHDKNTIN